jgi:hypothetical protein
MKPDAGFRYIGQVARHIRRNTMPSITTSRIAPQETSRRVLLASVIALTSLFIIPILPSGFGVGAAPIGAAFAKHGADDGPNHNAGQHGGKHHGGKHGNDDGPGHDVGDDHGGKRNHP